VRDGLFPKGLPQTVFVGEIQDVTLVSIARIGDFHKNITVADVVKPEKAARL
jgi:hypothetical protein